MSKIALVVSLMAVATLLVRALPFLVLGRKKPGARLEYLGRYLPQTSMLLMVIYCLKDTRFERAPYGLPEFLALLVVTSLQFWRRNTLLSIGVGTSLYLVLRRGI